MSERLEKIRDAARDQENMMLRAADIFAACEAYDRDLAEARREIERLNENLEFSASEHLKSEIVLACQRIAKERDQAREALREALAVPRWKITCLGSQIHPAALRILEELETHMAAIETKALGGVQ